MKLLFFDLETTGTDYRKHAIHQISGEIVIDGEIKERFNYHVRPFEGAVIEDKALEVGKVTKEQITAYPIGYAVYQEFIAMLSKYVDRYDKKDKFFLVGYNNAPFDNQFLREFFLKCGDYYFGSWFWSNSIDVMVLVTPYLADKRHEMVDFKLATVAKTLGINVKEEDLHDAYYDVWLTHKVYDVVSESIVKNL